MNVNIEIFLFINYKTITMEFSILTHCRSYNGAKSSDSANERQTSMVWGIGKTSRFEIHIQTLSVFIEEVWLFLWPLTTTRMINMRKVVKSQRITPHTNLRIQVVDFEKFKLSLLRMRNYFIGCIKNFFIYICLVKLLNFVFTD